MAQLVELKKHASEFEKLNAEMVFVFREESEGVEGLKKIKEKHDPPFRLTLDFDKKSSKRYSSARMTFANFVVDNEGKVRGIVDGTLRDRATPDELIKFLKQIQEDP